MWKGRVGWGAIFNRRRDKEGIISNAGKVTTDKHLIMGERGSPWIPNADSRVLGPLGLSCDSGGYLYALGLMLSLALS